MTADYPDWMSPGQQVDAQYSALAVNIASYIATGAAAGTPGGVPLLGAPITLYTVTNQALAAAAINTDFVNLKGSTITDMSGYLSYDLTMRVLSNSSSPAPFTFLKILWADDPGFNYITYFDGWVIPSPSGTPFAHLMGNGPVYGRYMTVQIDNFDSTFQQTVTSFTLSGNSRPCPTTQSNWRTWTATPAIPGYVNPSAGLGLDGVIGYWSRTLAAGQSEKLICGLLNNQLLMGVEPSGTSPALLVQPQAFVYPGTLVNIDQSALYNATPGSLDIWAPRSPVVLVVTNTSATNPVNYIIDVVPAVSL